MGYDTQSKYSEKDDFNTCIEQLNELSLLFVTTHGGLLDVPALLKKAYLILQRDEQS